jgi:hypothetical protein
MLPTFTGLKPYPEFQDLVNKINTLVQELQNLMLNLDSINVRELRVEDGNIYYVIDEDGIVAFNGTENTLSFDLATGILTLLGVVLKSSSSLQKVEIDSTGFHAYDTAGIERITIGTAPAKGAKALIFRDSTGAEQTVMTYDTETVDGASRTGQYMTAHGSYMLIDTSGNIRIQRAASLEGIRILGLGRPEMNAGGGWGGIAFKSEVDAKQDAFTGHSGDVIVGDGAGGTKTLTFSNGVLTNVT